MATNAKRCTSKGRCRHQHRGRPKLSLIARAGNKGGHDRTILTGQPIANVGQDRGAYITADEAVKPSIGPTFTLCSSHENRR